MNPYLIPAILCSAVVLSAQKVPPVEAPVKGADSTKADGAKADGSKPTVAPVPGKTNSWFPNTDIDLGTYMNHETARGTFKFKNPNDKPMEWKFMQGSCTCSRAQVKVGGRLYEMTGKPTPGQIFRITKANGSESREKVNLIQFGPNEEGEVEVHMEMGGVVGPKSATLTIHTTDPELPMITLKFQAMGAQLFVVSPAEVNLSTMTWNEKREFTATVMSPIAKDFKILRTDPLPPEFAVSYDKVMRDGVATWTIHGSYGPLTSETGGGGQIRFYTDVQGESQFSIHVMAQVKGPLELSPGSFVPLGLIRHGTGKSEKVVLTPNDNTDLQATNIRFEQLSFEKQYVTAKTSKDGNKLVVEVEVSKDAPAGLVRGNMIIELNHPHVKEKVIMFNGMVR